MLSIANRSAHFRRVTLGPSLAVACVAAACAAVQAQYAAQILNPPGASVSAAWGAYNGWQIGNAGGLSIQSAALWHGTPASAIPLNTSGTSISYGLGIGGSQQVGMANGVITGNAFHAFLWTGSAGAYVDLNPAGYDHSAAYATDGTYQAGQAASGGVIHAMLWSGSAGWAVDLNPAGYDTSHAYGAWNGQQVGIGTVGGVDHALLWSGSPTAFVDLNGSFDATDAYAMDGTYQVGSGAGAATGGETHALKWSGTAASVVDIHSAAYTLTVADGIGANVIAGYGSGPTTGYKTHALAWVGGIVIDLHNFLPAGYSSSYANGADLITGQVVGEATNSLNRTMAFMWTPVPRVRGDMDCDGVVNAFDIDGFVQAIINLAGWQAANPGCNTLNGDINCDGDVNAFDIDSFVLCLTNGGTCPSCP
jgi:hypothetical protein